MEIDFNLLEKFFEFNCTTEWKIIYDLWAFRIDDNDHLVPLALRRGNSIKHISCRSVDAYLPFVKKILGGEYCIRFEDSNDDIYFVSQGFIESFLLNIIKEEKW